LVTLVAAIIVNLVLLRLATRPLRQLVATVRQIARGDRVARAGPFNSEEFTYLADAINTMSSSLAKEEQHRRLEMTKARQIQDHLLPNGIDVPGLALSHIYQPAADIAGDYYDVVGLPDGTWVVCVADVTGHGVPAAMSATILKTLLLHATEHHTDPSQILRFINDRFSHVSLTDDFASMLLARWKPKTGTLEYASGGHEPAWLLPSGGPPRELPSTGWLLGVHEEGTWETETLRVNPGDRLWLFTDGVTEAANPRGVYFGRERLAGEFSNYRGLPIGDAIQRFDEVLAAHREDQATTDDVTVVAVDFVPLRPQSLAADQRERNSAGDCGTRVNSEGRSHVLMVG
jgi:serine phosphatase RsbU (regulator of sigma subunit)